MTVHYDRFLLRPKFLATCAPCSNNLHAGASASCAFGDGRARWGIAAPAIHRERQRPRVSKVARQVPSDGREPMNRAAMYGRLLGHPQRWDMIVVGGGATGVGTAID